jgi:hypothetical protein
MSDTPLIVLELRRENAALRAEVERWRRQERWVFGVAVRRIQVLEDGIRSLGARVGGRKRAARILAQPVDYFREAIR